MILLLSLLACGDKADDSARADDRGEDIALDSETVPLDGHCADDVHFGKFVVDSTTRYAYVDGEVDDGVVPYTVLTELESQEGCTLWRREYLYCDPACDSTQTCDFDGTCVPYPVGQDVGVVTVDGLLEPVSMEPLPPGNTYSNTSVPNPPWTPGTVVTLESEGGAYDPFTLHGVAPDPLEVVSTDWTVYEGEPLPLSWTPPGSTTRAQVRVTLNIDQHGNTPVTAVCWLDDDGEGAIPADILDGLMGRGISGFPSGTISRLTTDAASVGEGCVDLWLTSSRAPTTVSVDGYTPCISDVDCPEGQECNEAMQRCE